MEAQKTCTSCKLSLPQDFFYLIKRNGNSRISRCKDCESKKKYEKRICDCGREYTYTHYQRHLKSNLHKRLMGICL